MVDQKLIDYIKKSSKQGFSEDIIKSQLKKGGWADKEINEAISGVIKPEPKVSQPSKVKPEVKPTQSEPSVQSSKPKPKETPKITQEGMPQEFQKKEQESEKESKISERKKCPDCGTPYASDDSFCGECGKCLEGDIKESVSSKKERKENVSKLKEHLSKDEKIVAVFITKRGILDMFSPPDAGWYATSKRVIKFKKTLIEENLATLPYNQISSLILKSSNYYWLLLGGVLLIIVGVIKGFSLVSVLLIFLGIAVSVDGLKRGKHTCYQFTGSGLDEKEWKIEYKSDQKEIKEFVKVVEKKLG